MKISFNTNPLNSADTKFVDVAYQHQTLLKLLNDGGLTSEMLKKHKDDLKIFKNGSVCTDYKQDLAVDDWVHVQSIAHGQSGRLIGSLALSIGAGLLFGPEAAIVMSKTQAAFASGAFILAGGLLLNKLFPPPKVDTATPKQLYDIANGANAARLSEPLPIVLGKHRFALDLAANPYPSFEGGESYFYGVYSAGFSDNAVISNMKIGDTLLSTFNDIEIEESTNGVLNSFPVNVDTTIVNKKLINSGDTEIVTGSTSSTRLQIDASFTLFHITNKGKRTPESITIDLHYRLSDTNNTWVRFSNTSNFTLKNSGVDLLRKSYIQDVPSGKYDVRVTRVSGPKHNDKGGQREFTFHNLKSFQPDANPATFEHQKRWAIKYKATNDLNGSIKNVNAIISNKTRTWNGSSWTQPVETSNPAWWFLHLCSGLYSANGQLFYGAGIPDSELDIESIKAWAVFCNTNNLTCDMVLTQNKTLSDTLQEISRLGRASLSFHNQGKLGVIIDDKNAVPIWVCNPSNILKDSFQISYRADDFADGVKLQYVDASLGYKDNSIEVYAPGVTTPKNLKTVRINGITNSTQAAKEANLILAGSLYNLRTISFSMDAEGAVLYRGAIIHVTSNIISWAKSGRLLSGSSKTILNLSESLDFPAGTNNILIKFPDGEIEIVPVVNGTDGNKTVTLAQSLTNDPAAFKAEDIIYQYSQDASPGSLMKIVDLSFSNHGKTANVKCIDFDQNYYNAENGNFTVVTPPNNIYTATVSNVQHTESTVENGFTTVSINWDLNVGKSTEIQMRRQSLSDSSDKNYINLGETLNASYSFDTNSPETVSIRLTPIGVDGQRGEEVLYTFNVNALNNFAPEIANVSGIEIFGQRNDTNFIGKDVKITWRRVAIDSQQLTENIIDYSGEDAQFLDYVLTVKDANDTLLRTEYLKDNNYQYTFEKNFEDSNGNPNRVIKFSVVARGKQSQTSLIPAVLAVQNVSPVAPVFTLKNGLETVFVDIENSNELDIAGYNIYSSTVQGFTPDANSLIYSGVGSSYSFESAGGVAVYVKVAAYDTFNQSGLNFSAEQSTTPSALVIPENPEWRFDSLDFKTDAATNTVSWTAGVGTKVKGDTNVGLTWTIASGNATWSTGTLYLYVNTSSFSDVLSTTNIATALTGEILGSYTGGNRFQEGGKGNSFIDGDFIIDDSVKTVKIVDNAITETKILNDSITTDKIQANAITTNKIAVNAITSNEIVADAITTDKIQANAITSSELATSNLITQSAQINSGIINTAHIADAQITDAKIGNIIQSSNYNPTTNQGWKLDKAGSASFNSISIFNAAGNIVMQSGVLNWSAVGGSGTPENNATSNSSDSVLLNRSNHSGLQDYTTINGTKPPSDADKTSSNTAAGITGQGALATLNSADYATNISGTKPPSNATANSSDATLLNRQNHSGSQPMSTVSDAGNFATLDQINSSNASTYIASLSVDRLLIANNAATIMQQFSSQSNITATSGFITILTGTITLPTAEGIIIQFGARYTKPGGGSARVFDARLVINGVVQNNQQRGFDVDNQAPRYHTGGFFFSAPAGTTTVNFQASTGFGVTISDRYLTLFASLK